jgi:putative hydrolase of the HAD superfamily
MVVKVVFFDAAGTLFRVRGSVGRAYAAVAARHGVTVDPQIIEQRFRDAFRRMPPLCFPEVPESALPEREQSWWKQVVAAVFADVVFTDFEAFFHDLFAHFARAESWELFPDTRPALRFLRRHGLRLGIVSNFDDRLIAICNGLDIADSFEAIVMSARVGYAKPDPRIFAVALQRFGVGPTDAIHVGDSAVDDLQGGQAAGLHTILLQRKTDGERNAAAIHDLGELCEQLQRRSGSRGGEFRGQ